MILDPLFDRWVWLGFLGLLVVFGIRAWVVESTGGRATRAPGRVRLLTVLSVGMVAVVCGLLWVQGGQQAFESIVHRTDPLTGLPLDGPAVPVQPAVAPDAGAPAAPGAAAPAAPAVNPP
ncbi:hypothetical protein GCM10009836_06960 [Pseudonocardia ailaonensis]|uniref:Uncharacterized protein n=1 Tax=Pseudonocardia ailaonensis TaxID=367279 RepID=A0ABN2MPM5_9PSEU